MTSTATSDRKGGGSDTLCIATPTDFLGRIATLSHPIVFSYDAQVQPEFWLGLNPGLMLAERKALQAIFREDRV